VERFHCSAKLLLQQTYSTLSALSGSHSKNPWADPKKRVYVEVELGEVTARAFAGYGRPGHTHAYFAIIPPFLFLLFFFSNPVNSRRAALEQPDPTLRCAFARFLQARRDCLIAYRLASAACSRPRVPKKVGTAGSQCRLTFQHRTKSNRKRRFRKPRSRLLPPEDPAAHDSPKPLMKPWPLYVRNPSLFSLC